jgi:gamma-aminobutyric acid receptor subunit alpha
MSRFYRKLLYTFHNAYSTSSTGPPAVIEVDIMVRSMGPISEVDMVSLYTFCINHKFVYNMNQ